MITLTAKDICEACAGELLAGSGLAAIGDISTDTRDDLAGKLFVALRGDNFDGGEFVEEALASGALGIVAERSAAARAAGTNAGKVIIAVDDSGEALKNIGSLVSARSGATVVAITGSTGKTSTKDMLSGLLAPRLEFVASRASFNNEVGVPLTLLQADEETEIIVVEMGMQAPGEITELCRIATPDIAVITNVGPAHLKYAGSLENIARGKAEIAHGLPPGGRLVLPFGDSLLEPHLQGLDLRKITFGFDPLADIHPIFHEHMEDGSLHAVISVRGREIELWFNFAPHHHLLNMMAAIGAYDMLGLPLEEVPAAVEKIHLAGLRGELVNLASGVTLLNDCYNANPLSMRSSLDYLASVGTGRRTVAIIGDMAELGEDSREYHLEIGRRVAELGIDCLFAIGDDAIGYIDGARQSGGCRECCYHFADRNAALAAVPGMVRKGDVALVKASRFMRLEELSEALAGADGVTAADASGNAPAAGDSPDITPES
ncbi:MAG: UDP-N-acetylmuramoyl-tripeptide--D-alanyl-D-alanine ligase [Thermoleophilia bacterium]|nr:UDP-N-acetylmuramoyl-tripeptide--D-alanyl-D-alanine ligase [Thermoleophilia bacterium]